MEFTTKKITHATHPILIVIGRYFFVLFLCSTIFLSACNNSSNNLPANEIVSKPELMDENLPSLISEIVKTAVEQNGKIDSSVTLLQPSILEYLYDKNNYAANWSRSGKWTPAGDSLINFIEKARLYGLFPEDYHFKNIATIRNSFVNDSLSNGERRDAVLWSKADVLLSDALIQIIKDIKLGRLQKDSLTLRTDSTLTKEFYEEYLQKITQTFTVAKILNTLEPEMNGYHELKAGIKKFLDSVEFKQYSHVPNPTDDPQKFKKALQIRLFEEKLLPSADSLVDSLKLSIVIKHYQEKKNLKADGKPGAETIRLMNLSDKEKFVRIALSLDKYKMFPAKMPSKYVWVNLAGYYLQLWEGDSVKFSSKVVVGKPLTRTPELTSAISELITYPQWTIPQSIIVKEILPALKKNPGYLAKKGFSLLDSKNEEVDPFLVDWSKYKKGIPYRIIQGSGDANALGVMKFNFPNKYAVYLHDTNQRYLFGQTSRAFSHGCVRVQEWQRLTNFILRNENVYAKTAGIHFHAEDSVYHWLKKKEKHSVMLKSKLPVFIRYFTCEGRNGQIYFYDDIYNEDRRLIEKYFAGK